MRSLRARTICHSSVLPGSWHGVWHKACTLPDSGGDRGGEGERREGREGVGRERREGGRKAEERTDKQTMSVQEWAKWLFTL